MSTGDKILSENYFQHADHFMRILSEREIQKKTNYVEKENLDKNEVENKEVTSSNKSDDDKVEKTQTDIT